MLVSQKHTAFCPAPQSGGTPEQIAFIGVAIAVGVSRESTIEITWRMSILNLYAIRNRKSSRFFVRHPDRQPFPRDSRFTLGAAAAFLPVAGRGEPDIPEEDAGCQAVAESADGFHGRHAPRVTTTTVNCQPERKQ